MLLVATVLAPDAHIARISTFAAPIEVELLLHAHAHARTQRERECVREGGGRDEYHGGSDSRLDSDGESEATSNIVTYGLQLCAVLCVCVCDYRVAWLLGV